MWKAAAIIGAPAFFLVLVASFGVSPLCGLVCIAPMAGALAGYLAAVFDKPATGQAATRSGTVAGALAGTGALLGQILAGVVNAMFAPQIAQFVKRFVGAPANADITRMTALVVGICGGLVDLLLMAGLGALCAYLAYRFRRPSVTPPAPSHSA